MAICRSSRVNDSPGEGSTSWIQGPQGPRGTPWTLGGANNLRVAAVDDRVGVFRIFHFGRGEGEFIFYFYFFEGSRRRLAPKKIKWQLVPPAGGGHQFATPQLASHQPASHQQAGVH